MDIGNGAKTLDSLITDTKSLSVPTFQRGYAWNRQNIDEFWRDVRTAASQDGSHFYGPLVLLKTADMTATDVIDGQQRLTTAFMCLAILRDIAATLKTKIAFAGTMQEENVEVALHKSLFAASGAPYFEAAPRIRTVFRQRVLQWPRNESDALTVKGRGLNRSERLATKELRAGWLWLDAKIREDVETIDGEEDRRQHILKLHQALTKGFEIHTMVLSSEQDAYDLFETLNARGLRLTPGDIVKTLILKDINQNSSTTNFNEAASRWEKMFESLDGFDMSRFMRHWLASRSRAQVRTSDVLPAMRKEIRSAGALASLDLLERASTEYGYLLGVNDSGQAAIDNSSLRLNVLSDTHRIMLLGLLLLGDALSSDDLVRLFRATEHLQFWWLLTGGNAQQLEKKYQDFLGKLRDGTSAGEIVSEMLKAAGSTDDFKNLPVDHRVLNANTDHVKYLLHRLEQEHGAEVGHWTTSDKMTLEHIAPQEPKVDSTWFEFIAPPEPSSDTQGSVYDDYVERWGNLTMLEFSLNASIKNSEWSQKLNGTPRQKKCISRSTYSVNRPLLSVTQWTRDHIDARTIWLRDMMFAAVGESWVRSGQASTSDWKP